MVFSNSFSASVICSCLCVSTCWKMSSRSICPEPNTLHRRTIPRPSHTQDACRPSSCVSECACARAQVRPGVYVPALVVGDLGMAAQLEHLLVATLHPRHLVQGLFHLGVPDQDNLKKTANKNEDEASSKRIGQPSREWVRVSALRCRNCVPPRRRRAGCIRCRRWPWCACSKGCAWPPAPRATV